MTDAGRNSPPDVVLRALDLIATANRWLAERPVLKTQEEAGLCDSYISQLRDSREDLGAALKVEREPIEQQLEAVRAKYRDPAALVEIALEKMLPLATEWLQQLKRKNDANHQRLQVEAEEKRREAERLQAEAQLPGATVEATLAAQRAQKAADKAATAAKHAPKRARLKGEYSDRAMSLRGYWSATITDERLALDYFKDDPTFRAAVLDVVLRLAKAMSRELKDEAAAPPGFAFMRVEKAA
jgi:hypothetical protein